MLYTILGALHLVLWLIAAIELLKSGRPIGEKVLWLLIILLLPLVGLVFYYVLGRK
jgi:hypothetical protein